MQHIIIRILRFIRRRIATNRNELIFLTEIIANQLSITPHYS